MQFNPFHLVHLLVLVTLAGWGHPDLSSATLAAEPEETEHFEKVIRPLLVKHCYECHSHQSKRLEGGLYLDSRQGLLTGGDSGTAMIPGDADKSRIVEAVRYQSFEMPPKGKLPEAEIQLLVNWVQQGAPWPDEPPPVAGTAAESFDWKGRKQSHWSWQPIRAAAVPAVKQQQWPRNEIDHFVLSQLEQSELAPAAAAEPSVWLRRVYLDLIGLPPTPEQLQAFLQDQKPGAHERVVDELLSSPRYGEKWARHWMDLVRYAETYGHEFDFNIPNAYRYRDYLIRAFNLDVPYDQFVREQIAGDLLPEPRLHPSEKFNESLIGPGFWFLGEAVHAPTNVRNDLSIRVENQIDVFSRAILGLSVACARCHDHKFDAISKEDYYALYGILNSSHRDIASLDVHHQTATAVQNIAAKSQLAKEGLRSTLQQWSETPADELTDLIELALLTPSQQAAIVQETPGTTGERESTTSGDLNAGAVARWVNAFADPRLLLPTHPLYPVAKLRGVKREAFVAERRQVQEQLQLQTASATSSRQNVKLFADFNSAEWNGWQHGGLAFGTGPSTGLQLLSASANGEISLPGVASSRLHGSPLSGAIRSPLFTIQHPFLHYRIRASGATVRLVVENYFMDHFQPLLFADLTRKSIQTDGAWKWVTHGGDIANQLGGRAYLEILDHGTGTVEIDDICFSTSPIPAGDAPSETGVMLAGDAGLQSQQELASVCSQILRNACAQVARNEVNSDAVVLINWMLQHQLIDLPAEHRRLLTEILEMEQSIPAPVEVLTMVDGPGLDEPVHIRGSDENFGPDVPRRFLLAIAGEEQAPILKGSGRLELARLTTSPENPFLSRVLVNRLWHQLFGRGIVPSVDDFGAMGQAPSHPELLDWLAMDFQTHGYSIKRTLKQLVLSSTYGMSSQLQPVEIEERDPENVLLHRMPVRRLSAEALRDSILLISGRLDPRMYGDSVPVHLTEFMEGRGRPGREGPLDGAGRRSVYQEVRRNFLSPMMLAFDMPSPFSCMGRRSVSNVPAQSLILMNDPFIVEQAQLWAGRSLREADSLHSRIHSIFMAAYCRNANDQELQEIEAFLERQSQAYECSTSDQRVWSDVCHMLFNTKEFLFVQ